MSSSELPRVLVVSTHAFNLYTGGGLALTNYFKGWPKDRLCEVYSDHLIPNKDVCERFYELSPNEIRWIWPLSMVYRAHFKNRALTDMGMNAAAEQPAVNIVRRAFGKGVRLLGGKALFHRVRLTPELRDWIAAFKPDLLFCQLGDLPLMDLIWTISEEFRLPLSLQVPDNWIENDYRSGVFMPLLRRRLVRTAHRIVTHAALRFSISDRMSEAYQKIFGVPFVTLLNPVETEVWGQHARNSWTVHRPFKLAYVGTLVPNAQLESLLDVAAAVRALHESGVPISLTIYTTEHELTTYRRRVQHPPCITMEKSPPSPQLASLLAQSDLLVLPVNFDAKSLRYIRYSMPGKIPAYMCSGTPILVYGPMEAASVEYAARAKWAEVVLERNSAKLQDAVRALMNDEPRRRTLGLRAKELARSAHDAKNVRVGFQQHLIKASRAPFAPA